MKLLPLIPRRSRASQVVLAATALLLALAMPVWIQARTAQSSALPASGAGAQTEAFSTTDMEWQDAARARRVPGTLFWPTSGRERKVPLIVFSHGIGSSRDGYTHLGRYWASHGIASLHLQHVGSDRTLWQGNVLHLLSRFQNAAGDAEAIARVQDLRFALDRLLESEYGGRVARDRIVAAGHSYGANTTLMVAGARVIRDGRPLQLRDPRISAAIVISAPPFYGESDFAPILSDIAIPTLHITTRDDVIRIPGFGSGLDDRLKVFDAIGGFKVLAVYKRGSHNVFTDRRYFDSLEVASEIKADTQRLSLAFLAQVYAKRNALDGWAHSAALAEYKVRR